MLRTGGKRMVNTPKIRHGQRPKQISRELARVATPATTTTTNVLCHKIFECKVRDLQLHCCCCCCDCCCCLYSWPSGASAWRAPARRRRARTSSTLPPSTPAPASALSSRKQPLAPLPPFCSPPLGRITNWSRQHSERWVLKSEK